MTIVPEELGIPSGGPPKELKVSTVTAEEAPAFFASLIQGPLRDQAERDLADGIRRLELTRHCVRIQGSIPDPADLGYLQASWGLARWSVEMGACAVLDGEAARWFSRDEILKHAPGAPFDLRREISVIFEVDPTPGFGHAVYTRGMVKFGRPDLIIPHAKKDQLHASNRLLLSLGHSMALGSRFDPPEILTLAGSPPVILVPYEPDRNAPDLYLDNKGLVVSDADPGARRPLEGIDRFERHLIETEGPPPPEGPNGS